MGGWWRHGIEVTEHVGPDIHQGISTTHLPFCRDQPGRQVGFQPHERPVGWSLTNIHRPLENTC